MNTMQDDDNNLTAVEYVLGILDADERARFQQALQHDEAARDEVIYWEDQLAEVGLKLAPVTPPDSIWQQINMQTGIRESGPVRKTRFCIRKPWRMWAAAAGVAAVTFAMLVSLNQNPEPGNTNTSLAATNTPAALDPANAGDSGAADHNVFQPADVAINWSSPAVPAYISPDFVGKIQDYASSVGWNVSGYSARGALEVSATGKPYTQLWEPATLELWLLPVNSYEEPISLGLLPISGARQIPIPSHVASEFYTDYNKLAVSVEPPGGSETGEPTGDILFITTLSRAVAP